MTQHRELLRLSVKNYSFGQAIFLVERVKTYDTCPHDGKDFPVSGLRVNVPNVYAQNLRDLLRTKQWLQSSVGCVFLDFRLDAPQLLNLREQGVFQFFQP
jgi:hypothetical protein